jgi:hypothetical protein
MAPPPAPRMLSMVSATSHYEQWSRASIKINDEDVLFFSNSLEIEIAR